MAAAKPLLKICAAALARPLKQGLDGRQREQPAVPGSDSPAEHPDD